ncbi:hypothetical protein DB347_01905 [Opitutaceae bacterium EW11]|nr:hypothetical protein DB347_01905 [Opitutaceae bacterium EW11]
MNKVTTVNLAGNAFQIEENGYAALQSYLEGAARRLEPNPDKDEILADIEAAIADKFRAVLGPHKSVVLAKEVENVIAEMGPVQDDADETGATSQSSTSAGPSGGAAGASAEAKGGAASSGEDPGPAKRLYKIPEGAMLAGVCNGVATYFSIDPIVVRLVFLGVVLLSALISLGAHWFIFVPLLAYGALAAMLPSATTAAERAAARGDPATAQEYIRRAKQGYYDGLRSFGRGPGRRHWRREFKRQMRAQEYRARHYGAANYDAVPVMASAPAFALPILGFIEFGLVILAVWTIVLLVSHGSVWGIPLPDGVPLWIGVVALAFFFHVAIWPIKAAKHALVASVTGKRMVWTGGFFDSLVWLAAVVAAIWLADHYIPQVHEFLVALPAKTAQVADSVSQWWKSR